MEQRSMHQASVGSLSTLETNKVLKNTYLLLSATLGFSAVMASLSMAMNVPAGSLLNLRNCLHGSGYVCAATHS